jgi:hypothetical protein
VLRVEESSRAEPIARAALGVDQLPIDAELTPQPLHEDLQTRVVTFSGTSPKFRANGGARYRSTTVPAKELNEAKLVRGEPHVAIPDP